MYPYIKPSLFAKGLETLKSLKFGTILDGTQKTLGVINQAIPVIYQVKPIINNTKTLFKIANVMNSKTTSNNNVNNTVNKSINKTNTSPIFYI